MDPNPILKPPQSPPQLQEQNLGLGLGLGLDPNLDKNNLNQIIDLQTLYLTEDALNQATRNYNNNDNDEEEEEDDEDEERELKQQINDEEEEEELKNESQTSELDENEVNKDGDWDQIWKAENDSENEDLGDNWRRDNEIYNEGEESDGVNENGGPAVMAVSKEGAYHHNNNNNNRRSHYPVRPEPEDCPFYKKTGTCKFGPHCKFNHPPRKKSYQGAKEKVKLNKEYPERPGQIACKYYLTSGGCKYGKACRYNHSRGKTSVAPVLECNFLGLPIRLGKKECPNYMRTGSCKYGSDCRFNHPDPTAVGGGDPPSRHSNDGSVSLQGASKSTNASWSSTRVNEAAPNVPMMFPPTQCLPSPNPEWSGYQAPVYPTSERILPTPPAFAIKCYSHHQHQMLVDEFPERPGQPECSYLLKSGNCKYRSNCKFHHPKSRIPKMSSCILSDKGLPLRPDQNICSHYNLYGICKVGPACKFDHPISYGNSTSSVGSEPDQPPFFGNSTLEDGARRAGYGNGSESLI